MSHELSCAFAYAARLDCCENQSLVIVGAELGQPRTLVQCMSCVLHAIVLD